MKVCCKSLKYIKNKDDDKSSDDRCQNKVVLKMYFRYTGGDGGKVEIFDKILGPGNHGARYFMAQWFS